MLSRSEEKLVRGLHRRRMREREGLFLAEGVRVAQELVRAGTDLHLALISSSLEDSQGVAELRAELERRCEVRVAPEQVVEALSATDSPQGIVLVARTPSHGLADVRPGERAVALVLDAVQDPGNLGTLVRSAHALGAGLVAALPGTVEPWNPKAVRASAGAVAHLPPVRCGLPELAGWLEEERFTILAADMDGAPIDQRALPGGRIALVVGNEGAGVGPDARSAAHGVVSIPIEEGAESLNVAVAAGILLYLLTRGRT